jgi:acyl phosphate:glycerol-3-phosphate acyltransferase
VFSFVLAGLLGYLLGSLPTAYLLVRWKSSLDVRSAGSGNVGTLNSYQVTGSFAVGAAVLAVDAGKGVAAVALARALPEHPFACQACAGFFAVLGHNFPVWLRFRGGRGLATAAGVMVMFSPLLVIIWGILWAGAYRLLKDINSANAAASVLIPFVVAVSPGALLSPWTASGIEAGELAVYLSASMLLVIVKLFEPVRAYIRERRAGPGRPNDKGGG